MAFLQAQTLSSYSLAGAGAITGATSVILKSFQTIDGANLTMADFGTIGYATLEPGNSSQEEQISFTGVTQNANGTATLTGVKTVLFVSPYTETSGLAKTHPGSSLCIISNTAGFYEQYGHLQNDEVITGYWEAPDPLANQGLATKLWVENLINGGDVSTNALIEVGTAGETVAAGDVVYLKAADGFWWKALGTTAATVNVIQLGIAQGAGTAGNPITGGVLRRGIDTHQSGGAAGSIGYVSNTSTIATSTGTVERVVGNFITATTFAFDPFFYYTLTASQKAALAGSAGTPSASNPFITQLDPQSTGYITTLLAGETLSGATLPIPVYQNTTDNELYACDANDVTKYKFIGFVTSTAGDGVAINLRTTGIIGGFSGLDEGVTYYVSDTVGTIQNTPGTQEIEVGIAVSPTQLLIRKGTLFAEGAFDLSTSVSNQVIVTGFRPSRIVVQASLGSVEIAAGLTLLWTPAGVVTTNFSFNDAGGTGGTDSNPRLSSSFNNDYIAFGIQDITATGFTISLAETGTFAGGARAVWTAEGNF